MNIRTPQEIVAEKIRVLFAFQEDIRRWFDGAYDATEADELRSRINRTVRRVSEIVREAGCLKLFTIAPPPAVGGLVIRNANPFDSVLESYYGMSPIPSIIDMIDETVGVLESPEYLEKLLERANESEGEIQQQKLTIKARPRILLLCKRFHLVARKLQDRHAGRSTLVIEDEYDVQDLFGSLLRLDFDDIRKEEWTPSYAGKSARVDFLLKRENIVIEIKRLDHLWEQKKLATNSSLILEDIKNIQDVERSFVLCTIQSSELEIRLNLKMILAVSKIRWMCALWCLQEEVSSA